MPTTTTTTNMLLPVPIATVTTGPEYATDINQCFTQIDQHDHTTGKGVPINPAGISINADLPFTSSGLFYNATNLRSVRFNANSSPLSLGTDVGCVYVSGIDLYYNDVNGTQIRMTQSGTIAGPPGSITGLVPPANVTYSAISQTFTFQSTTATAANIDAGSYTMRNLVASAPGITLSPPAALASNYTMTLPLTLPSSGTRALTVDASGNIGASSAILPPQNGNAGKYLTTDGANPSWALPLNQIRLYGSSGYGSTLNQIPLFIQVVQNASTAITFIQNASSGASFLINSNGYYAFGQQMESQTDGNQIIGLSLNATSAECRTPIYNISATARLIWGSTPAASTQTSSPCVMWQGFLNAGDVVRPHNIGNSPNNANYASCWANKIL